MNATRGTVVASLCDSSVRYKYYDLLTYLLTYIRLLRTEQQIQVAEHKTNTLKEKKEKKTKANNGYS